MKLGLRLKLAFPMVVLWVGLYAGFNYYWLPSFLDKSISRYSKEQEQKVRLLTNGLVESVLRDDLANIYATLSLVLIEYTNWEQLTLRDADNNIIYPLDEPPISLDKSLIRISYNHEYGGVPLLHVELITDPRQVYQEQEKFITELKWMFFTLLFIALAGSILLEDRLVCRPIRALARAAKLISDKDFTAKLPLAPKDEMGQLINSFDAMRSDMQLYQEDLLHARDEALKATRVKSEFLANMSHELRTPLNAILGYSELIEEELCIHEHKDHIEDIQKIQSAGSHLLALISDILDLTKIEAGKMELQVGAFSLTRLIKDVVTTIQPLAAKNDNAIELCLSDEIDMINTDNTKLRQILLNLLSNACKFTSQGVISVGMNKLQNNDEDCFEIEINDTGIGIPQEKLDILFDAFTQVDSAYNRKYQGSGLGLALSRQLAQLLGGDIMVCSEINNGSKFTVYLPVSLSNQQKAA